MYVWYLCERFTRPLSCVVTPRTTHSARPASCSFCAPGPPLAMISQSPQSFKAGIHEFQLLRFEKFHSQIFPPLKNLKTANLQLVMSPSNSAARSAAAAASPATWWKLALWNGGLHLRFFSTAIHSSSSSNSESTRIHCYSLQEGECNTMPCGKKCLCPLVVHGGSTWQSQTHYCMY